MAASKEKKTIVQMEKELYDLFTDKNFVKTVEYRRDGFLWLVCDIKGFKDFLDKAQSILPDDIYLDGLHPEGIPVYVIKDEIHLQTVDITCGYVNLADMFPVGKF